MSQLQTFLFIAFGGPVTMLVISGFIVSIVDNLSFKEVCTKIMLGTLAALIITIPMAYWITYG